MRLRSAATLAVLISCLGVLPVGAQSRDGLRPSRETATTQPLKSPRARAANPCLQYGSGFARIEGTDTCVKIGGSLAIGGSVNSSTTSR